MGQVQCNQYHSGNRQLAYDRVTDTYECQGCMTYYTGEEIRKAKQGPKVSYTGSGGVVRTN